MSALFAGDLGDGVIFLKKRQGENRENGVACDREGVFGNIR